MKTISRFDETTVKEIQARAFELLAPLQAEFGVTFGEAGKGFGRYYCTVFFKMNVPPEEGDRLRLIRVGRGLKRLRLLINIAGPSLFRHPLWKVSARPG